jgi:ribosomal protein L34
LHRAPHRHEQVHGSAADNARARTYDGRYVVTVRREFASQDVSHLPRPVLRPLINVRAP